MNTYPAAELDTVDEHGEQCDDPACCAPGHLLIRSDGFVATYAIDPADPSRGLDALRSYIDGARTSGDEPLMDAWLVPAFGGELVALDVRGESSAFDADDYADAAVVFTRRDNGDEVVRLGYRIDGRA